MQNEPNLPRLRLPARRLQPQKCETNPIYARQTANRQKPKAVFHETNPISTYPSLATPPKIRNEPNLPYRHPPHDPITRNEPNPLVPLASRRPPRTQKNETNPISSNQSTIQSPNPHPAQKHSVERPPSLSCIVAAPKGIIHPLCVWAGGRFGSRLPICCLGYTFGRWR
jgi:hypothetical protein